MNYITEILAFNDLIQVKRFSAGQIALWYALMYINNICGWEEWFTVTNLTLQLQTGLSRDGINKSRNVLKQYGLIDFRPNSTKATSYKLNTMSKSSQVSIQDSSQVSIQDSSQVSSQVGSALNKLNETINNNLNLNNKGAPDFSVQTIGEFQTQIKDLPIDEQFELKSKYLAMKHSWKKG